MTGGAWCWWTLGHFVQIIGMVVVVQDFVRVWILMVGVVVHGNGLTLMVVVGFLVQSDVV